DLGIAVVAVVPGSPLVAGQDDADGIGVGSAVAAQVQLDGVVGTQLAGLLEEYPELDDLNGGVDADFLQIARHRGGQFGLLGPVRRQEAVRIAVATRSVDCTISGDRQLGRMWRNMMRA